MALLVLAVKGYLDIPRFVYANVGDDSENPDTVRYVREVAFDYAWSNGIELHEVGPARGITIRQRFLTAGVGAETIPVRGENGAPFKRACTAEWKVAEVEKWCAKEGYTPVDPATVAIGFSTDEFKRAQTDRPGSIQRRVYPLLHIEWHGRPGLSRANCAEVIRDAGLPVPPKSSCYFCPLHKPSTWAELARDKPDLFEDSCRMEETMLAKRSAEGKRPAFFTRFGVPLRVAVSAAQEPMFRGSDWDEEDYRCGDVCDT